MKKLFLFIFIFTFFGIFVYGQTDSLSQIDSLSQTDSLSQKEQKKERKRLIKYQKISSYHDTIVLVNGNILVGEFKRMDKSVVTFKTKYSDSDFKIKWGKVHEFYSDRYFLISTEDGARHTSSLQSIKNSEKMVNLETGTVSFEVSLTDIVFLEPIGKNFLSRLTVDIDAGVTLTKANNLRQLTTNLSAKYLAYKWRTNAFFKTVLSRQDSVSDISRMDGELGFTYFLPGDWFGQVQAIYLSNDEQKLDLRSTYQAGIGYYFVHNNNMYFGGTGGLAYTNEVFTNDTPTKSSTELYFALGIQKYDIGDLSILSTVAFYPSITEEKRFRTDFNFEMKYDLPLDFFIKMSLIYNYDNQPVEGAANEDYVFTTSFGWEFN